MFAFVFRLVGSSPSSEYNTIKLKIFKESSHFIFQKRMKIPTSHFKVLCLLFIKSKKRICLSLQQPAPKVFYMLG